MTIDDRRCPSPCRLYLLALAGLLALGSGMAHAQPRGGPQAPPRDRGQGFLEAEEEASGTARIAGRVVAADSGSPLRRAQVRVTSREMRIGRMVSTDPEGGFVVDELPAGRYTVTASKAGFVSLSLGQARPFEPGRPIELSEKQQFDRADFALPRGSVITGRVVDEFGEAVADATVSAVRFRYQGGERQLTPAGRTDRTDDIGQFRVFGLSPGNYYVTATLRTGGRFGRFADESDDPSGYAPTYYPGTPNLAEAQRLTVGLGEERVVGDFGLMPTRTARISGTAVDSLGNSLSRAQVVLQPRNGLRMFGGRGGHVGADGTFTISRVPPGEYTLLAFTRGRDSAPEFAMLPIVVTGDDVAGLYLMTTAGTTATGRITFDAGVTPDFRPSALRLSAVPIEPVSGPLRRGGGTEIADDWSFQTRGLALPSLLRLSRPPKGWALKTVFLNGRNITDLPLEPRGGRPIEGLEVVLTTQISEVSGTVADGQGRIATDYTVVLFARDRDRWTPQSRFLASARPDQEGRFQARTLPPGEFLAVALDFVEQGEWQDPELLQRLVPLATPFELEEGETKTLELPLSARP